MFRTILNVVRREVNRITSEAASLFVVFFGPLLAFFIISSIFYSGVPVKLPVAVVDSDHSSISRKAIGYIGATPVVAVNTSFTSLLEAKKALEQGKADAALYIPEGTEKSILKGGHANIELYLNNANVIKGSLLNNNIQKAIKILSAGIKLQTHLQSGETQDQAMAQILPVRLHSKVLFNPFASYAYFITIILLPVMLTVFVLFGTLYAIGTELQYGSAAEWLQTSDNSIMIALTGKLFPYTLLFCVVAACMNLDLFTVLGLPLHGSVGVIIISELLLILSYQVLGVLLITVTKNMRLALSLASGFTMLAITYTGFTFPFSGMPAMAMVAGKIFPITYWLNIFSGQSLRAENISNSFVQMLYLIGFISLGGCFIPLLKDVLFNKKNWGKI